MDVIVVILCVRGKNPILKFIHKIHVIKFEIINNNLTYKMQITP